MEFGEFLETTRRGRGRVCETCAMGREITDRVDEWVKLTEKPSMAQLHRWLRDNRGYKLCSGALRGHIRNCLKIPPSDG